MARPVLYDQATLLKSLRETFLELGPSASTRLLAERAGVSEGTLFKRFGTKRELFLLAMKVPRLRDEAWFQQMASLVGRGTLVDQVEFIAAGYMDYLGRLLPLVRMILASGQKRQYRKLLGEPPTMQMGRVLASHFEQERSLGRMDVEDTFTLAAFLTGACLNHVLTFNDHEELRTETMQQAARRFACSIVALA